MQVDVEAWVILGGVWLSWSTIAVPAPFGGTSTFAHLAESILAQFIAQRR